MILERIDEGLPGIVLDQHCFRGDATVRVPAERLLALLDFLYDEGFQMLVDITAVDGYQRDPRFEVVYHLLNLASQERLRIQVPVGENRPVPSLTGRFRAATWFEREIFDLFGIPFTGHPDLRRLLMWEDFPGHPLRKDFPLDGGDPFCSSGAGAPYTPDAHPLNP